MNCDDGAAKQRMIVEHGLRETAKLASCEGGSLLEMTVIFVCLAAKEYKMENNI